MNANTICYRDILKQKLTERSEKNKSYSLRAFARDLGLSPQRLSNVLNGKHGLSPEAARKVGYLLDMNEEEREFFCTLVQEKHSRSKVLKHEASKKIESISSRYKDLSLDHFKIISDWYHFAIMELTLVVGFSSRPKWIAKTLKISEMEAKVAIERLLRLELLELDSMGVLKITGNYFADPKGTPSEALRNYHRQLLAKATESLDFQSLDEREVSSTILAINEEDLPKAKEEMQKFRRSFDAQFSNVNKKSQVYCLGMQFFNLTK